jgi:hypothetical protein
MPAVLVHGVPDTAQLWDRVCAHLERTDIVTPGLPGFATPVPAGFDASKEAYVDSGAPTIRTSPRSSANASRSAVTPAS